MAMTSEQDVRERILEHLTNFHFDGRTVETADLLVALIDTVATERSRRERLELLEDLYMDYGGNLHSAPFIKTLKQRKQEIEMEPKLTTIRDQLEQEK